MPSALGGRRSLRHRRSGPLRRPAAVTSVTAPGYSRVGFVHHYRPLSAEELAFVLARHWPELHLDDTADFTGEAVAAITRITSGNFRLTGRLIAQIQRILDINHLSVVTSEVVEAARESLVIGVM
jgi:Holliday junction resolvasome RuvABC ATP-dependent DNA helicase subunit